MAGRIIVFAIVAALQLCGCRNQGVLCDEDSSQVRMARSLEASRLEKLVADARAARARLEKGENWRSVNERVPPEFTDLDPFKVDYGGSQLMLVLKHCMDHGVFMRAQIPDSGKSRVTLSWGEHATAGEQVLWTEP